MHLTLIGPENLKEIGLKPNSKGDQVAHILNKHVFVEIRSLKNSNVYVSIRLVLNFVADDATLLVLDSSTTWKQKQKFLHKFT